MSACMASLYIHIPFCIKKCDYCDFYSACDLSIQNDLLGQIPGQIAELSSEYGIDAFNTLYFGGGTPGLVSTDTLGRLVESVKILNSGTLPQEVTLECNPANINAARLGEWKDMGMTRLSLGVQSFSDDFIKRSGRNSSRKQILRALEMIKTYSGFHLNIDLIQGLPGMTGEDQIRDLEEAVGWNPDHLSWYSLILEDGTVLERDWDQRNGGVMADNDRVWEEGCSFLEVAGYNRYEISNFCRPGQESRHNKSYWKLKPYMGCGPSAVSMLKDRSGSAERFRTVPESAEYAAGKFRYDEREILSPIDFLKDFLLMGLRLNEGIASDEFCRVFGYKPESLFPDSIQKWAVSGCLNQNRETLSPTQKGMNLLNSLLIDIFSELDAKLPEISLNWPSE